MSKIGLSELTICNLIEKAFHLVCENHRWNEVNFCTEWLKSNTASRLEDQDETLICQSKYYIFHDIESEIKLQERDKTMDTLPVEWFGYITMYWAYLKDIDLKKIADKYDIGEILTQYPYLHTMSVKAAISDIEENYSKVAVMKDKAFGR